VLIQGHGWQIEKIPLAGEQPGISFPVCEVAKGSSDRRRDLTHLIVIAVRVACPGEVAAEEAVVVATRHDVNVKVRHALADDIVDRHERAFAAGGLGHGTRQALRKGEERSYLGDGQIGKGRDVRPGYQENMAGQERASIEECDPRWLVEDDFGRSFTADDGAEDTSATARAVARLELDVEDHAALSCDRLRATRRNR
jgi:hypothetical protein